MASNQDHDKKPPAIVTGGGFKRGKTQENMEVVSFKHNF